MYLLSCWWSSPQYRFSQCLTNSSNKVFHDTKHDRKFAILSEAWVASKPKEWSGYFHLTALATVLARPVFSSYPNCQTLFTRLRSWYHLSPNGHILCGISVLALVERRKWQQTWRMVWTKSLCPSVLSRSKWRYWCFGWQQNIWFQTKPRKPK